MIDCFALALAARRAAIWRGGALINSAFVLLFCYCCCVKLTANYWLIGSSIEVLHRAWGRR